MNIFKEKYNLLTNKIEKSKNKLQGLNGIIAEKKSEYNEKEICILSEKIELDDLNKKRNKILSSKDKYVNIPMYILFVLVGLAIGYFGYNIITSIIASQLNLLPKILLGLLTVSIGGSLFIAGVACASFIAGIILKKIQGKIIKTNSEYKKLSETISNKDKKIKQIEKEKDLIKSQIDMILEKIQDESSKIRINTQGLEKLKKEMINFVLKENIPQLEETKPYKRSRILGNKKGR